MQQQGLSGDLPILSVIIPTRNRAHLVPQAIESVLRVGQKLAERVELELIVVDDGSTDATEEVVRRYPVRYLRGEGRGASAARNIGIRAARGPYIGFLDDDDTWLPTHVAPHLDILERRPDVAAVFAQQYLCDDELKPVYLPVPSSPFPTGEAFVYAINNMVSFNSVIARKTCLEAVGCFDEEYPLAEDWDLSMKLAARFGVYGLSVPVALIRQHRRGPADYAAWAEMQRQAAAVERRGVWQPTRARVPFWRRAFGRVNIRGRSAYLALCLAQQALDEDNPADARRFVLGALRRSTPHTLKLAPQFRRTLLGVVRGRAEAPRPGETRAADA